MNYCRCCGQQIVAEASAATAATHSTDIRPGQVATAIQPQAAPPQVTEAEPDRFLAANDQAAPKELRWDAHLSEVFDEAERLRSQIGGGSTSLNATHIAYAMSRMISVAPLLEDARIDARSLRHNLRHAIEAPPASSQLRQRASGSADQIVTTMQALARTQGARKVGVEHLIAAFSATGQALQDYAADSPDRNVEIYTAPHPKPGRVPESTADMHAPQEPILRDSAAPVERASAPTRQRVTARRMFRDPRQLTFRGLTPVGRDTGLQSKSAASSQCVTVQGEVTELKASLTGFSEILSRIDARLGDLDVRLRGLEQAGERYGDAIRSLEAARIQQDVTTSHADGNSERKQHRQQQRTAHPASQQIQASSSSTSSSASGTQYQRPRGLRRGATRATGFSWLGLNLGRKPGQWLSRSDYASRRNRPWSKRSKQQRDARQSGLTEERGKRFYLALADDVVDAPSIGPKTADRLRPHGVMTVRDLLRADPDALAAAVNTRHITADVISDWQLQSRLVITVPWLRGTHAQLLVGAGYFDAEEVAASDVGEVMAAILRYAATREGQRVLRDGPPPPREKVAAWVDNARAAEPERAA